MSVSEHLHQLGGFASQSTLVRLTSRRQVERAVAAGDVLVVSRGRCALPTADEAVLRAQAVRGVVSHRSAAAWWGWELKEQPRMPEVTVRRGNRTEGSRVGVHVCDLHPDDVFDNLVTSRERTLVDCLRTLPPDEALAIADSALRHGASPNWLVALAASVRGPGAPGVRRIAALARGEAANPFESVLRWLALEAGLDVEPQVTLRHGRESARPDLVDIDRRLVLEADSFAWHGTRAALRRDCHRYNWLVRHGWTVLRFAYEDVMGDPAPVLELLRSMCTPARTDVSRGVARALHRTG